MNNEVVSRLGPSYNTQTLFLMTWGRRDGDADNPELNPDFKTMNSNLLAGYTIYQQATRADGRETYVAPAGLVFEEVYDNQATLYVDTPDLFSKLYSDDGSHPSGSGTYASGLTILCTITGRSPLRPWGPSNIPVNSTDERLNVRRAVHQVLFETKLFVDDSIQFPFPFAYPQLSSYPSYTESSWDGIISGYVPLPTVRYDGRSNTGGSPDQVITSLTLGDAQDEGGRLYVSSGTLTAENGCVVGNAGDGVLRVTEGGTMDCGDTLLLGAADTAVAEIQLVGGTLRANRIYRGSADADIILDIRSGVIEVESWELDAIFAGDSMYIPRGSSKFVDGSLTIGSMSTLDLSLETTEDRLTISRDAVFQGIVAISITYDFPQDTSQLVLDAASVSLESDVDIMVPDGFRFDVQSLEDGRQGIFLTNGELHPFAAIFDFASFA
jgi:hypothetical protein